jgi:hypothetical protein
MTNVFQVNHPAAEYRLTFADGQETIVRFCCVCIKNQIHVYITLSL